MLSPLDFVAREDVNMSEQPERMAAAAFGLIVVGSEVLDGRRNDAHFDYARQLLRAHELELKYALIVPDDEVLLEAQLRWAMARREPFFCCGGIGATPDDLTRQCAARAAGVGLEFHPEGVAILERRWGKDATPARLRMVEFPAGSALVPNPFNQVPGFSIRNGYFVPGFPEMAHPMMAWVLETLYLSGEPRDSGALVLPGAREADLSDLMEAFVAAHPDVSFSSLPRYAPGGTELHLGVSGLRRRVGPAFADLQLRLSERGLMFTVTRPPA